MRLLKNEGNVNVSYVRIKSQNMNEYLYQYDKKISEIKGYYTTLYIFYLINNRTVK